MNEEGDLLAQLSSDDSGRVYSALIQIGKAGRRDLESVVSEYLSNPDPDLQSAAFRVLAFYWALPSYRGQALELVRSECAPELRSVALMAVSSYECGTRSPDILQSLLAIAGDLDPELDSRVRSGAYHALLDVLGVDAATQARARSGYQLDRIDWRWVEQLLEGTGVHVPAVPARTVSPSARLGVVWVTYEKLELDRAAASYGSVTLTCRGEPGLVRLIHDADNYRREWVAILPGRTWSNLVSTLAYGSFPRVPPDKRLPPGSHTIRSISWERHGVVESVVLDEGTTQYGDVDDIASRLISRMAPDLVADPSSFEEAPDTRIEMPFVVKTSSRGR